MFLLTPAAPPEMPQLIQYVIEEKKQPETELTPEQKLAQDILNDVNNCEPKRYIRADNAECGAIRPEYRPPESSNASKATTTSVAPKRRNTAPPGWFSATQCTGYVASRRPVGLWNDGYLWYSQAQRDGWATGLTPTAGAIGVARSGNHVVFIHEVKGNKVYLSERNYDFKGSYRERWANASDFRYIY